LPSFTPYSLWEVDHNDIHHGHTNLKDVDFVWQPLLAEEYAGMDERDGMGSAGGAMAFTIGKYGYRVDTTGGFDR
jgi:fatty acid desaturase